MSLLEQMQETQEGEVKFPEKWIAQEEGEGIEGELSEIKTWKPDFMDFAVPVWVITQPDGERYQVSAIDTVLREEIQKSNAGIGDHVAIKYFGKRTSPKSNRTYKKYAVATQQTEKSQKAPF